MPSQASIVVPPRDTAQDGLERLASVIAAGLAGEQGQNVKGLQRSTWAVMALLVIGGLIGGLIWMNHKHTLENEQRRQNDRHKQQMNAIGDIATTTKTIRADQVRMQLSINALWARETARSGEHVRPGQVAPLRIDAVSTPSPEVQNPPYP